MDSSNRPFWEEFIDLYRQNNCLWDVKSKDYNNKIKRNESYKILLDKLKESIPGATMETLKKKINNIRTSFRRELKKVQDSKAPGAGSVYEPMLWYYNLLSFIAQSEAERKEKSDDDDDYVADLVDTNDINFLNIQVKEEDSILGPDSPDDIAGTSAETQDDLSQIVYDASTSLVPNSILSRKRKSISNRFSPFKQKKFSHHGTVPKASEEDEFIVTGKKFAFQLKRMDDHQRLIAEKLISDVMFFGGMGKLSEDTVIQIPSQHDQEYC